MKRDSIDFHEVRAEHVAIDLRLVNWARWASGGRGGAATSPMFRLYRSSDARQNYAQETGVMVDRMDAQAIEKAVCALPEKHRDAIRWSYVYCYRGASVQRACQALAVNGIGLAELVHDGRQMLVNRRN